MTTKDYGVIKFYEPNEENGWLANFSAHPFELDGVEWKTVEHYFQAQKFPKSNLFEKIRNSEKPADAKQIAKANKLQRRQDWNSIKILVMYKGIKAKFCNHKNLKQLLVNTNSSLLVEDSEADYFWGVGKNGDGKNVMGNLLMILRNEIQLNVLR